VRTVLIISFVALAVIGLAVHIDVPTRAHHSNAPFYDETKSVEVVGVVSKFVFRNPHSFVYITTTDEDGTEVEWELEMLAAVSMTQRGWTPETISAGDEIKAVGSPSKAPGTRGMCCAQLTRPDGSPFRP
jgi:hypothetical protein